MKFSIIYLYFKILKVADELLNCAPYSIFGCSHNAWRRSYSYNIIVVRGEINLRDQKSNGQKRVCGPNPFYYHRKKSHLSQKVTCCGKKSRAVAKSQTTPKNDHKKSTTRFIIQQLLGVGGGAAEARVVEKRILKTTACGDHPDRIQWGYALLRYTVKSSQVVGLRDRVAIIRTLTTLTFSSPHPYRGALLARSE